MLNIIETPWLILAISFLALAFVTILRNSAHPRYRPWHLLYPLILATAGFAIDFFVTTDTEKINTLIETASQAVTQQDIAKFTSVIDPAYSDFANRSKKQLITFCQDVFARKLVEKIVTIYQKLNIENDSANAECKYHIHTNQENEYGISLISVEIKLNLKKNNKKQWLINNTKIISINKANMNWKQIKTQI